MPIGKHYQQMEDQILELIAHNKYIKDIFSDGMIDNVRIVDAENHLNNLELWHRIPFDAWLVDYCNALYPVEENMIIKIFSFFLSFLFSLPFLQSRSCG